MKWSWTLSFFWWHGHNFLNKAKSHLIFIGLCLIKQTMFHSTGFIFLLKCVYLQDIYPFPLALGELLVCSGPPLLAGCQPLGFSQWAMIPFMALLQWRGSSWSISWCYPPPFRRQSSTPPSSSTFSRGWGSRSTGENRPVNPFSVWSTLG